MPLLSYTKFSWTFYSDPFVYKSFPEPIPHCFNLEDVKCFTNSNRISHALSILFKYFLAILGCLFFHINFIINLSTSRKKPEEIFIEIALNL